MDNSITYGKIENGKYIPARYASVEQLEKEGYKPYLLDLVSKLNADSAVIQDGEIVDISETDGYKSKIAKQEKEAKIAEIAAKIDELDKKRIRAGFEPSIKNEASGQTWLEYYTLQIQNLRDQIIALN